jgi:hypothetical protein
MTQAKCSEPDFLNTWRRFDGNADQVAAEIGTTVRNVLARRRRLESKLSIILAPKREQQALQGIYKSVSGRISADVQDGVVLVASDAHYLKDERTVSHRALVKLCGELKPRIVVMNGDILDGGIISRWPRIGWENRATVKSELETVTARLSEISDAARGAKLVWPLGNHDARFELRLAANVPEYEGVGGFTLKEHFPEWIPCWSLWVNDEVVVKHRFKSGIHAVHNNTMWAGKTILTGHLHSLKVMPLTDYNGTRWGVDTGTLSDPYGPQYEGYMEDSPRNWRQGFIVLTFHKGRLMWPEIAAKFDDESVEFRGQLIKP